MPLEGDYAYVAIESVCGVWTLRYSMPAVGEKRVVLEADTFDDAIKDAAKLLQLSEDAIKRLME